VSSSLIVIPAYGVWIQDTDLNSNLSVLLDGSVKYGLTPSAGTGLTIAIATGKAVIEGHEITDPTGSTITVPASTSSSIWLQLIKNSSGQVTGAQYTVSVTQPSDSILLCNFTSGTSSVSSVTDARTIGAVLQTYDQNANPVTRMIIPGGNTQGNTLIKIYEGLLTKNNTLDDGSGSANFAGHVWAFNNFRLTLFSSSNASEADFFFDNNVSPSTAINSQEYYFSRINHSTYNLDLKLNCYDGTNYFNVLSADYPTGVVNLGDSGHFNVNILGNLTANANAIIKGTLTISNTVGGDPGFQTWNYNATLGNSLSNFNLGGLEVQINGAEQFTNPVVKVSTNSSGGITDLYSLWYSYLTNSSVFTIDFATNAVFTKWNYLDDGSGNITAHGNISFTANTAQLLSGNLELHSDSSTGMYIDNTNSSGGIIWIRPNVGTTNANNMALSLSSTGIKTYNSSGVARNILDDGSGNATITGVLTNTVGGDLSGTALNAVTIAKLQGQTLTLGTPSTNQVIAWNGSAWVNTSLSSVSGVSSLNGLTGALTIQSPNGTINVTTSSPNINIDINLAHSNAWSALQTFPDIEVITGTGQALALGVSYNTAGTSQLNSPGLNFTGTGYYNTSGGLATMNWQFYAGIGGGSTTAQSSSTFIINPPNNTLGNFFNILNIAPTSAGTYNSAGFILSGYGYDTAAHEVDWLQQVQVTSQAGASTYHIQHRIGSNAFADAMTISDAGNVTISNSLYVSGLTQVPNGIEDVTSASGTNAGSNEAMFKMFTLNDITGARWRIHQANYSFNIAQETTTAGTFTDILDIDTGQNAGVGSSTVIRSLRTAPLLFQGFSSYSFDEGVLVSSTIGQALALGYNYTTAGTSQLSSPSLYFAGTGYYNTSGGLATMSWQFYNAITGGNNTTQSVSTFNIIPPSNNAGNYFEIFNAPFILANTIGGDAGFQIWNFNAALGNNLFDFTPGGNQFQINGSAQFTAPVIKVSTNSTGGITNLYELWYSYISSSSVFYLNYVTNAVKTKYNTLDDGSTGTIYGANHIFIASHGLTFGLENESGETPPHFSLVNSGIARIMQFQIQSPYNAALAGGLVVGTTNTEQISTGGEILATNLVAIGTSSGTDSLTGGGRLHSGQTGGHQVFIGASSGGGQTSYTWICPPNVNSINVTLYGAGGGGGGGGGGAVVQVSGKTYYNSGGGGGGGGSGASIVNFPVAVTPGTSYTIYVGNGGTGGGGGGYVTNGNTGGNGGASQAFNLTAGGGIGGGLGTAGSTTTGAGGTGGSGSGSNGTSILFVINSSMFTGANGGNGTFSQVNGTLGGAGGGGGRDPITGFFAGGGAGGSSSNGSNGVNGFNYSMGGGGGGGAAGGNYSGGSGGNGAPGAVIIDW
jgi:hypothetical protein